LVINRVLSFLAAMVVGLAIVGSGASAQETPRGNAANGKKLFETTCFECHGYSGQGGGAGPKLIDPPAYPAFIVQLRTPRNVMPPFTARVLTDQQAADLYAYISTFPKAPDAKAIPLLQN
jgi:ubiquinol-cytochrome c reductase cytochrome c subunit